MPVPPDLIVLRHGETEWNVAGLWQGALDSPLTARGADQARALGAMFAAMGLDHTTHRIVSSPQGRARRTATLAFGPTFTEDADLREIGVGDWTGTGQGKGAAGPHGLDMQYDNVPGGEGLTALATRCRAVLARLHGPSILVTHGVTGSMLRRLALGRDADDPMDLPGEQGVAFRIRDGHEERLAPAPA